MDRQYAVLSFMQTWNGTRAFLRGTFPDDEKRFSRNVARRKIKLESKDKLYIL